MLYLLDTNVLIYANNRYYAPNIIPQYWAWLKQQAENDMLKIPTQVIQEIFRQQDDLAKWVRDCENILTWPKAIQQQPFNIVLEEGYGCSNDSSAKSQAIMEKADIYLITHALQIAQHGQDVTVVTNEQGRRRNLQICNSCGSQRVVTSAQGTGSTDSNKIPDVCSRLSINCIEDIAVYRTLNFSTKEGS